MSNKIPDLNSALASNEGQLTKTQTRISELRAIIANAETELHTLEARETATQQTIGKLNYELRIALAENILSTQSLINFATSLPGIKSAKETPFRTNGEGPVIDLEVDGAKHATLNFQPTEKMCLYLGITLPDQTQNVGNATFTQLIEAISTRLSNTNIVVKRDDEHYTILEWHNVNVDNIS